MRLANRLTRARALALVACLVLCAGAAFAQENANAGSETQNAQQSNRSTSTQTTRTTTTTTAAPTTSAPSTTTSAPAQTTTVSQTRGASGVAGIDPLWLIIGAVALLAIVLIVALSARGRSRSSGTRVETVRETTVKRE